MRVDVVVVAIGENESKSVLSVLKKVKGSSTFGILFSKEA